MYLFLINLEINLIGNWMERFVNIFSLTREFESMIDNNDLEIKLFN